MSPRYLALTAVLVILSCQSRPSGLPQGEFGFLSVSGSVQSIAVPNPSEGSSFYSHVDRLDMTFLESSDDCLLGMVDEVKILDSLIFVIDRHIAQSICVFDRSGSYLYPIGRIGRGKGEYQSLSFAEVCSDKVTIMDGFARKMLQFNHDGNLISETSLSDYPSYGIYPCGDGSFLSLYSGDNLYFLSKRDSLSGCPKLAIYNSYLNLKRIPMACRGADGNMLFHISQSDTVYSVRDTSIYAKYILGVHDYDTNEYLKQLKSITNDRERLNLENSLENPKVCDGNIEESNRYFTFSYRSGADCYYLMYDRSDGHSDLFRFLSYLPGYDYITYLPGMFLQLHSESVICTVNQASFSRMDPESKASFLDMLSGEERNRLESHLENINNNPVICVFHLKQ